MNKVSNISLPFFILLISTLLSCSQLERKDRTNIKSDMRDAYVATAELYTYVWSTRDFEDDRNHQAISSTLKRLAEDFHNVEKRTPVDAFEPGFRITLEVSQSLLKDALQRFQEGKKDYANWRLRSLSANCISCHSRYEVKSDFIGTKPLVRERSIESRKAEADFLFATRQFDKASAGYFRLARSSAELPSAASHMRDALKSWLAVEIRVLSRAANAKTQLTNFAKNYQLAPREESLVRGWIADLEALAKKEITLNSLGQTEKLLEPIFRQTQMQANERSLVRVLHSTSFLHQFLLKKPRLEERRRATYLLAMGYRHLPIPMFDVFKEFYLEQCIREFPLSKEAQRAYRAYYELIVQLNSGSAGTNLTPEYRTKLKMLKRLAFGETHNAIS